jgi:putative uncharacterized protein (fragment)
MDRFLLFLLTLAIFGLPMRAQSPSAVADRVRLKSEIYVWSEGFGDTESDAKAEAVRNLAHKFSLTFSSNSINTMTNRGNGDEELYEQDNMVMASAMRFTNLETLVWEETLNKGTGNEIIRCHAFCYINREEVEEANAARRSKIKEMIASGMEQERQQAVGGALRYYCWAFTMLMRFGDALKVDVDGTEKDAAVWLPAKIESVLSHIKFDFAEDEIIFTPDEYDKHTVPMAVYYGDKPVQSLDFSYFNGERNISVLAKNGNALLRFVDLSEMPVIDIKVNYAYEDQAAKSYDEEISAAMASGCAFSNAALSRHKLPVKVKKNKIEVDKKMVREEDARRMEGLSAAAAQESPLPPEKVYKTIDRPVTDDAAAVEKMMAVERAIRGRQYDSVRGLFTDDGYESFRRLTNKAKLSVAVKEGKPLDLRVETTSLFKYGTGIPLIVRNGSHMSNEKMVFRFDTETGLIKSVAYALTDKAEKDIFRQAQWDINSRYSLLTFMEDYQTAYCTKNIDFIENLFSDHAIIIVGNAVDNKVARRGMFDEGQFMSAKPGKKRNFVMSRYTKGEYISSLRKIFAKNSWINVSYEENEISKVYTGGIVDNEVLWIEIRQNWASASGYNDTGFLALQINMRPSGSQINVRTFTPEFVEMDTLKKAFPVSVTLKQ